MNFIIPKNYKFKPKLFGLIDYQTAVLDSLWAGFLYLVVNLLFTSLTTKIYFFIGLFLPFFLLSIVGINHENMLSVAIYLWKFYKNQKIYLFKKRSLRFPKQFFSWPFKFCTLSFESNKAIRYANSLFSYALACYIPKNIFCIVF